MRCYFVLFPHPQLYQLCADPWRICGESLWSRTGFGYSGPPGYKNINEQLDFYLILDDIY